MPEFRHFPLPQRGSQTIKKTAKLVEKKWHYQIIIAEILSKLYDLECLKLVNVPIQSNGKYNSPTALRSKVKTVKHIIDNYILILQNYKIAGQEFWGFKIHLLEYL